MKHVWEYREVISNTSILYSTCGNVPPVTSVFNRIPCIDLVLTLQSPAPVLTYTILRSAHTVYLCVLYGSENKQRLFHCTALPDWFYNRDGECLLRGTFCPHSVFMCFLWISERTAIISLYSINWLVFITKTECIYCAVQTVNIIEVKTCMCKIQTHNKYLLTVHVTIKISHFMKSYATASV
jgi:hypothetical protein